MTMQECYKAIGGNYEAVLGRLHSEALIQRFTLKFLEDQSYLQLKQTLENKNYEDVQASLDAGMNAHLSKPIVIEEVIKTILRYVHNDQQRFMNQWNTIDRAKR